MTTYNTGNPLGSAAAKDLYDNAQNFDHLSNDLVNATWKDRFGVDRLTWHGIEEMNTNAIASYGWVTLDSFQDGAVLTLPNQALRWKSPDGDGEYYRWDGAFPKEVPSGSTPESTGGIGVGAWVGIGLGGSAGTITVESIYDLSGVYLKEGTIVSVNKNNSAYVVSIKPSRNSRIPIIQCSNGFLIPVVADDGSDFISCSRKQSLDNYQESGDLHAQGIEYDNARKRVFITSYRTLGEDQLTVIREYNINSDGTVGSLISSCENLPFGHSEYILFELAEDGKVFLWGHQGTSFEANNIIRLEWTGSTTGSNTPTTTIPVTGYGTEKPFLTWHGYSENIVLTFPTTFLSLYCHLDDLIDGNLSPYRTETSRDKSYINGPRIGQMIKHHGKHWISTSGYYMNAPLGTRTAATYETNALLSRVTDDGYGASLNMVDTSVSALNEIQSPGFWWDATSETFKTFVFSVDADFNLHLYAANDLANPAPYNQIYRVWNTLPNDTMMPSLAPGRAIMQTQYVVSVPMLDIGSTQSGNDGTNTNTFVLGDWTATQMQNNASRQECMERFYQAYRISTYGPSDSVRYMGHSFWDDRATSGLLGNTLGQITEAGWAIGHNPARAQYATNAYKYGLNVQPQTSADYGGIKSSVAGSTGRPCFFAGGNQRYAADGTVYIGLFTETTGAWNPLITGTAASVRFNAPPAPISDNTISNGTSALRWTQIYAASGTINTSDEREKTRLDISEAEKAAALEIKYNMWKFKFNDADTAKDGRGRIHFGVGAQSVGEIMRNHGLVPEDYAFFCFDEWDDIYRDVKEFVSLTDAEGNEYEVEVVTGEKELVLKAGNRYGIRYEELLCFMISSL